jgi:hypothetical protein
MMGYLADSAVDLYLKKRFVSTNIFTGMVFILLAVMANSTITEAKTTTIICERPKPIITGERSRTPTTDPRMNIFIGNHLG